MTTPEEVNAAVAYFRSVGVCHGPAGDHAATILRWVGETWASVYTQRVDTEADLEEARRRVEHAEQAAARAAAAEVAVREQSARIVEAVAASLDRIDPLAAELDATLSRWRDDPVPAAAPLVPRPSPRPRETRT